MKTSILLSSALVIGLTACATQLPSKVTYSCSDGKTVTTQILNEDRIAVEYDGIIHPMKQTTSASGTRYIGDGYQWWSKGLEGQLQVLNGDERYARTAGITCKTPDPEK